MRRRRIAVLLAIVASSCTAKSRPVACVPAELGPRVGVWEISRAAVAEVNRTLADAPFSYGCCGPFDPFFYDGETVTMKFFREKEWMVGPPGDLYRMESKWQGDDLYWLSTARTWIYLATWRDDHFEHWFDGTQVQGKDYPGHLWRLERVDSGSQEEDAETRAIAGPVGRWDYDRATARGPEHSRPAPAVCPAS